MAIEIRAEQLWWRYVDEPDVGAWSPDGRSLACYDTEGGVTVWDSQAGDVLPGSSPAAPPVGGVAFSPDGTTLAVPDGEVVQIRDAATGSQLAELTGADDTITWVAFHPTAPLLAATLFRSDTPVMIWDIATGERVLAIRGFTDEGIWCGFSPDGALLACLGTGRSYTAEVWRVSVSER